MNQKYPVHNPTQMPIYVGSTMIPPQETRHFDLEEIPLHLRPAVEVAEPEATTQADLVADLQKESMSKVLEGTALLNDADLQRLIDLEEASEKPRKTLLKELGLIQLKRAEEAALAALQLAQEEDVIAAIGGLNDADLQKLADLEGAAEAPRQPVLDAIAALQKQRTAAGQQ